MTTDEELSLLDQQLRRLKIEYEIFFNNSAKRPPSDVEWKVLSLIRKFSDGKQMSFSQRFKYNEMAQRYAVQSDLWRKKMRIREEGCRRPYDAMLAVQGVRADEGHEAKHRPVYGVKRAAQTADAETPIVDREADRPFSVQCSGAAVEREQVELLFKALTEAKQKAGEKVSGDLQSFAMFVRKKTNEIRKEHHCNAVVYSVEMQDGHVKLKATAKI
ncbi:MAG: MXAN_5187 C-terminal domain-containing protein [Terriglobales bacterium]